ncbi:hypothetical protein EGI20_06930 [Aquitalea sp. S1-19]|nr:hypothetical protein [Aquitalea sp. S1-19]
MLQIYIPPKDREGEDDACTRIQERIKARLDCLACALRKPLPSALVRGAEQSRQGFSFLSGKSRFREAGCEGGNLRRFRSDLTVSHPPGDKHGT